MLFKNQIHSRLPSCFAPHFSLSFYFSVYKIWNGGDRHGFSTESSDWNGSDSATPCLLLCSPNTPTICVSRFTSALAVWGGRAAAQGIDGRGACEGERTAVRNQDQLNIRLLVPRHAARDVQSRRWKMQTMQLHWKKGDISQASPCL